MRCNCQISFSSSFERPRFKLRSHRKRMDNATRIGRPTASVASAMFKSSEPRGVSDWVNGASKCRILEAGYSSATAVTNNIAPYGDVGTMRSVPSGKHSAAGG